VSNLTLPGNTVHSLPPFLRFVHTRAAAYRLRVAGLLMGSDRLVQKVQNMYSATTSTTTTTTNTAATTFLLLGSYYTLLPPLLLLQLQQLLPLPLRLLLRSGAPLQQQLPQPLLLLLSSLGRGDRGWCIGHAVWEWGRVVCGLCLCGWVALVVSARLHEVMRV
jgi:hypothetical protein